MALWNSSVTWSSGDVHFTFSIPQGADGATGAQGPPGEVTQSDLNNAVAQVTTTRLTIKAAPHAHGTRHPIFGQLLLNRPTSFT